MKFRKIKFDQAAIMANVVGGLICLLIDSGLHYLIG